MRLVLAALAAATLSGCTATMSQPGQAVPDSDAVAPVACNAARAEAFIGTNAGASAEEARVAAGARAVRVIRPDQSVTMDFRPDRLNIESDDAGTVLKVRCG